MDTNKNVVAVDAIATFRLPRFSEVPDVGLYLEQTTKYINGYLTPLGFEITGSMIRNYVKMGLVDNPVQKQYYSNHIAHLIAITVLKNVISLDNIALLFENQRKIYTDEMAYDYLCMEFENVLHYQFSLKSSLDKIGKTNSVEKTILRSAIIAVSHIIYLKTYFDKIKTEDKQ